MDIILPHLHPHPHLTIPHLDREGAIHHPVMVLQVVSAALPLILMLQSIGIVHLAMVEAASLPILPLVVHIVADPHGVVASVPPLRMSVPTSPHARLHHLHHLNHAIEIEIESGID